MSQIKPEHDIDLIERTAVQEFRSELFRDAVDACKDTLRERRMRPWWKRLIPYRIRIERL